MNNQSTKRCRVVSVVIKRGQVLLIHRVKPERDYYVFPGGKQETGETEGEALVREMKEELNYDIKEYKHIFNLDYTDHVESYYLIKEFSGELKLGGPEIERFGPDNKYSFVWVNIKELNLVHNLVPAEAVGKVSELLSVKTLLILVFLHGTVIVHESAKNKSRDEIIQQIKDQDPSVRNFFNYRPIGQSADKLNNWVRQGASIIYLSSLTKNKKSRGDELVSEEGLKADEFVLNKYGFPSGVIYHRDENETYADVVKRLDVLPDVIIEDDCESIGGESEMTYVHLDENLKKRIKPIKIKEFSGIDYLPDNLKDL